MKIRILPSSLGDPEGEQFLTSYLINDVVAIDAGCLGFGLDLAGQGRVEQVLLTHTHADHMLSLPVFLENFHSEQGGRGGHPTVYGSAEVLESLRFDLFNGRVWPDVSRLATGAKPYVTFVPLVPEQPVEVAGLRITPVPVNHVVPTLGLIVDDGEAAVVIPSDTGPTHRIWKLAERIPHLRAVFLEATFPDELAELANITGHLTPRLFAKETAKIDRQVALIAVHLRAHHRHRLAAELEGLGLAGLTLGRPGKDYVF